MKVTSFDSLTEKRVSFVLATKDRPDFMEWSMDNVKSVVTSADELIVVNQSRDDETLRLFEAEPGLCDLFVRDDGVGMYRAWNLGTLLARGRYVKWLTDDDLTSAEVMEETIAWMDGHSGVDVVYCGGIKSIGDQTTQTRIPNAYGQAIKDVFMYGGCLLGIVVRRECLARVGLFDYNFIASDVNFMARCISIGLVVRPLDVCLYYHPIYEHSGTVKQRPRWLEEMHLFARAHGLSLPNLPRGEVSRAGME